LPTICPESEHSLPAKAFLDSFRIADNQRQLVPGKNRFLRTPEAKQRLKPALSPGNVDKTMKDR